MTGRLRSWGWSAAALLAVAFLLVFALHGERPEPGLGRFVASGPMVRPLPSEVESVDVGLAGQTWRFSRTGTGHWQQLTGAAIAGEPGQLIGRGLDLLHNAAIERTLTPAEVAAVDPQQFALGEDALAVAASGAGQSFSIRFGGRNPLGLARYARIGTAAGIALLPDYVAEPWLKLVGGTP